MPYEQPQQPILLRIYSMLSLVGTCRHDVAAGGSSSLCFSIAPASCPAAGGYLSATHGMHRLYADSAPVLRCTTMLRCTSQQLPKAPTWHGVGAVSQCASSYSELQNISLILSAMLSLEICLRLWQHPAAMAPSPCPQPTAPTSTCTVACKWTQIHMQRALQAAQLQGPRGHQHQAEGFRSEGRRSEQ